VKAANFVRALAVAAAFFTGVALVAQQVDRNALLASEEFRRGIQAYNRYAFNEAILSLEKALSYKPSEALILDWLGRAYYRSGIEDTALSQWQAAHSSYPPSSAEALLLGGRMETVRNRRSLFPELDETARYVEAGRFPSTNGSISIYRQPTAVLPNRDGSLWVVAYGSNELLRMDPNGIVRQRLRGPLNGFDRPYDIARGSDGRLFVSEHKGNRVSVLDAQGNWKSYIGATGRGDGQFVGPQNLCVDPDGYLYVVDFGNRRVLKFGPDGGYLLSFGQKRDGFSGFALPTGVAAIADEVFVADAAKRRIARFDRSGNFIDYLAEDSLLYPEALRATDDGKLIVADTGRVALVDPVNGVVRDLGGPGAGKARIMSAQADANGNLVVADFQAGEITVMARVDDLSSGLFVQVERVVADKFPEIYVEVRVEDRRRRPIVGLDARNFLLSEGGRAVNGQTFLGSSNASAAADVSFLIERSPETAGQTAGIADALRDGSAAGNRIVSVVSAGEQPVKEKVGSAAALEAAARSQAAANSRRWRFDLALRLAATDLLSGEKKRAVVFVTSGKIGEKGFDRYSLSELSAYLANNGIRFYAAVLGDGQVDREVDYLCRQTGGQAVRVYRPEGIAPLVASLRDSAAGTYAFKYTSTLQTDFGRAYLPLEAEAYLLVRSGRDAVGYFAPLQ
jgi:DNA-binding beta-propeller fold protein YncE